MWITSAAVVTALVALLYGLYQKKQLSTCISEKVLAGQTVVNVPFWTLEDTQVNAALGVIATLLGLGFVVVGSYTCGVTWEQLKPVVGIAAIGIGVTGAISGIIVVCNARTM